MGLKPKKKDLKQKKKRFRIASREKQPIQFNPNSRSSAVMKFIDKPLSNFDLINWVKQLGIKHFRGVFSRDRLPDEINHKEVGIVNLDTHTGPGTHWVCYRNIDNHLCEYFDSFGLIMPDEIQSYLRTSGEKIDLFF